MNKKLLALLLAILMVAMSAVAMADTVVGAAGKTITVTKTYDGYNKANAMFEFAVAPVSASDPALSTATQRLIFNTTEANISNTKTATFTFPSAAEFNNVPGVYWYTLTETTPTSNIMQGVTYDTTTYYVGVTVYNAAEAGQHPSYDTSVQVHKGTQNGVKGDPSFNNTYASQDLTVTKKLAGKNANLTDTFTITVVFTPEDANHILTNVIETSTTDSSVSVANTADAPYTYTISGIGHNDTVTFTNIPVGTKYAVSEAVTDGVTAGGYTPSYVNCEGTIASADVAAVVTNTLDTTLDTGVSTDTMPYILLMAFVAILAVAFVAKKRSVNE